MAAAVAKDISILEVNLLHVLSMYIVTLYTALVRTFGLESSDRTMLNQLQQKLGFSK